MWQMAIVSRKPLPLLQLSRGERLSRIIFHEEEEDPSRSPATRNPEKAAFRETELPKIVVAEAAINVDVIFP